MQAYDRGRLGWGGEMGGTPQTHRNKLFWLAATRNFPNIPGFLCLGWRVEGESSSSNKLPDLNQVIYLWGAFVK